MVLIKNVSQENILNIFLRYPLWYPAKPNPEVYGIIETIKYTGCSPYHKLDPTTP